MTTEELADQINAEYWDTGGGCMAAKLDKGKYVFYFGLDDGLAWDIDKDDDSWRTGWAEGSEAWDDAQILAKVAEVMETLEGGPL